MDTFLPLYGQKAIEILEKAGFEAYAVGGCVRDFILCKTPFDIDITTSALPNDIIKAFSDFKVIKTGLKHGTVTVIIDSNPIEITTFRIDGKYNDSRHPENISFTNDIIEDLKRRDFTINAIAYNPKTGFKDPFGGKNDIKNKIIKTVGNPEIRFSEDALRILRALRFSSVLGFCIEKNTSESIHKCKNLLKNISFERINKEFSGIICGKNAEKVLFDYKDVINVFIPEIKPMIGFAQQNPHHIYDVYVHTLKVTANVLQEKVTRLCAFFHDIGKPFVFTKDEKGIGHFYSHQKKSVEIALNVLNRLRYDKKTISDVTEIIKYHDLPLKTEKEVKKWLGYYGDENFKRFLSIKRGDILAQSPKYLDNLEKLEKIYNIYKEIKAKNDCIKISDLKINGDDLIALGYKEGKKIGETLNFILEQIINDNLKNEKKDILDFLNQIGK